MFMFTRDAVEIRLSGKPDTRYPVRPNTRFSMKNLALKIRNFY
jgi:hypothetical protein